MKYNNNFMQNSPEPSTPSPIDPNVITQNGDGAKISKPYVLLVAGATGAASILLLAFIMLCIFMKRRKKANLDGKFCRLFAVLVTQFSDIFDIIWQTIRTKTKHIRITFKPKQMVFQLAAAAEMDAFWAHPDTRTVDWMVSCREWISRQTL